MRSCSYSIVHSFSAHLLQLPPTTTLQRKALRLKDSRSKNAKVVLLAHGETDLRVLNQGHISFNMPSEAERGNVCHHCTVKLFIHPRPCHGEKLCNVNTAMCYKTCVLEGFSHSFDFDKLRIRL